jgi:hypothetical protein
MFIDSRKLFREFFVIQHLQLFLNLVYNSEIYFARPLINFKDNINLVSGFPKLCSDLEINYQKSLITRAVAFQTAFSKSELLKNMGSR